MIADTLCLLPSQLLQKYHDKGKENEACLTSIMLHTIMRSLDCPEDRYHLFAVI